MAMRLQNLTHTRAIICNCYTYSHKTVKFNDFMSVYMLYVITRERVTVKARLKTYNITSEHNLRHTPSPMIRMICLQCFSTLQYIVVTVLLLLSRKSFVRTLVLAHRIVLLQIAEIIIFYS